MRGALSGRVSCVWSGKDVGAELSVRKGTRTLGAGGSGVCPGGKALHSTSLEEAKPLVRLRGTQGQGRW